VASDRVEGPEVPGGDRAGAQVGLGVLHGGPGD
jgi:hypothetical protein